MTRKMDNPNHYMGKETGYTLKDAVYYIAPLYQQQFDFLMTQEKGIAKMLEIVTDHAATDLQKLAEQNVKLWKTITDDIGLDLTKRWEYIYQSGTVKERKQ
jgi:hypothetical protein